MDEVFAFFQPYVDFVGLHYLTGIFIGAFIVLNVLVVLTHLSKNSKGEITIKEDEIFGTIMLGGMFTALWPVIFPLICCALFAGIYYLFVGLVMRVAQRRMTKEGGSS